MHNVSASEINFSGGWRWRAAETKIESIGKKVLLLLALSVCGIYFCIIWTVFFFVTFEKIKFIERDTHKKLPFNMSRVDDEKIVI